MLAATVGGSLREDQLLISWTRIPFIYLNTVRIYDNFVFLLTSTGINLRNEINFNCAKLRNSNINGSFFLNQ